MTFWGYVEFAVGMTVGVLGGTLLANLLIIWYTHRPRRTQRSGRR